MFLLSACHHVIRARNDNASDMLMSDKSNKDNETRNAATAKGNVEPCILLYFRLLYVYHESNLNNRFIIKSTMGTFYGDSIENNRCIFTFFPHFHSLFQCKTFTKEDVLISPII